MAGRGGAGRGSLAGPVHFSSHGAVISASAHPMQPPPEPLYAAAVTGRVRRRYVPDDTGLPEQSPAIQSRFSALMEEVDNAAKRPARGVCAPPAQARMPVPAVGHASSSSHAAACLGMQEIEHLLASHRELTQQVQALTKSAAQREAIVGQLQVRSPPERASSALCKHVRLQNNSAPRPPPPPEPHRSRTEALRGPSARV